ncbi:MAG TPA: transketolase [Candidatus Caccomorpha excrementavium]|nr:transketolase [Candidatus Caccomorpha excrementavium]
MSNIDTMSVNAIRVLAADAVQKAKSGHPGLPLGCAAVAYELWAKHMKHNPANPDWADRDRFILSGGHGSTLLYSLLHLFGYGLTKEDLASFRQLDSLTPGHPEYRHTKGVEATTGPLGAGMAMAVGMAIAEAHLGAKFNKEGYPVVDHYTFVLGGDGCMMEGISSEAFSLAGTLGLNKLIVIYDSNRISIEGSTDIAFTENVQKRMEAFGFGLFMVEDGNNLEEIGAAIEAAKADTARPSFITVKTQIGYGCPAKQGKASAHGEPLGEENVAALKENIGWPSMEPFYVPDEVYANYKEIAEDKAKAEEAWNVMFAEYCEKYPEMKAEWDKEFDLDIAKPLIDNEDFWKYDDKPDATRNLSGIVLNRLKDYVPNLIGGAADLAPSTKTYMKDMGDFSKNNRLGRNLHFGVREIAMAAIGNGITLHGMRAYVSTFFVFSDYVKPMARLSALMRIPTTYVLTHDSIGVGEDGPTHEPIEQLAMLRAMPNFHVFRPADATETIAAWYSAVTSKETPTALVLTRQNLPQLAGSSREALKGAYILADSDKETPDAIIIATGSEVSLAVDAKAELAKEGVDVRVVSMPCMDIFEEQPDEYKEKILPKNVRARVAVEALIDYGWGKYVGLDGKCVCMTGFGASAPAAALFKKYGFTTENVVAAVKSVL